MLLKNHDTVVSRSTWKGCEILIGKVLRQNLTICQRITYLFGKNVAKLRTPLTSNIVMHLYNTFFYFHST